MTHEIRSTVAVEIFLYIHIETKVIGTKVAVKIVSMVSKLVVVKDATKAQLPVV